MFSVKNRIYFSPGSAQDRFHRIIYIFTLEYLLDIASVFVYVY
jgi:hypothetical protein